MKRIALMHVVAAEWMAFCFFPFLFIFGFLPFRKLESPLVLVAAIPFRPGTLISLLWKYFYHDTYIYIYIYRHYICTCFRITRERGGRNRISFTKYWQSPFSSLDKTFRSVEIRSRGIVIGFCSLPFHA